MTSQPLSIKRTGSSSHDEMTVLLQLAFDRALALQTEVSDNTLRIQGMSGRYYRMFINNLVRLVHKPRYLEIGCYTGSTACAAMDRNIMSILCIDNWAEFEGPPIREHFLNHIKGVQTELTDFQFIESDFRKVDVSKIGPFNIYLYDGPHAEQDQYDGLALYNSCLDDDFIFMVDDWNWPYVRSGTFKAIRDAGFQIDYCIEVRTTQDGTHAELHGGDWHNGYFLSKLSRKQRRFT
jgi:hypothetical protein